MNFEKWLSELRDVNPSGEAPHKPLLLLTVLKAAERDGEVAEVLVLSPELVFQFKLFEHIVAHRRTQRQNSWIPPGQARSGDLLRVVFFSVAVSWWPRPHKPDGSKSCICRRDPQMLKSTPFRVCPGGLATFARRTVCRQWISAIGVVQCLYHCGVVRVVVEGDGRSRIHRQKNSGLFTDRRRSELHRV